MVIEGCLYVLTPLSISVSWVTYNKTIYIYSVSLLVFKKEKVDNSVFVFQQVTQERWSVLL